MCGIVGIVGPRSDPFTAHEMAGLAHRGPDATSSHVFAVGSTTCVIGHTRLRIVDLSPEGDQPMPNENGDIWVVYNGELYNHVELRDELLARGHVFRSKTDTEVIVHGYERHNGDVVALLNELRGMFAFAVIDQTRGRVVLARDRLGIKPLYWKAGGGEFVFASEARTVADIAAGGRRASSTGIAEYLMWGSVQGPSSILEGVMEVSPGSFLTVDEGAVQEKRWWNVPVGAATEGDDAAGIGQCLDDAVRRHLVADRPVGIFLSSGLDSSAVAITAAKHAEVNALTVSFPDAGSDELDGTRRFAREIELTHTEVPITGAEVAAWLPTIVASMDQPTMDGVNSWVVSRAAVDAGLVVALSGLGGDELFGGYPTFRLVPKVARLGKLWATLPASMRSAAAAAAAQRSSGGAAARVLDGGGGFGSAYRSVRGLFSSHELSGLPTSPPPVDPPDGLSALEKVAYLEMTNYLPNQLLRDADQMSMAHSLEIRVPLLDDRMVEAAFRIDPSVRMAPGKRTLAQAAGLPPPTEKRGFTLPFDEWLRGPLRASLREGLLSPELPLGDILPAEWRTRLWNGFHERKVHWSRPWTVAVLRWWMALNHVGLR